MVAFPVLSRTLPLTTGTHFQLRLPVYGLGAPGRPVAAGGRPREPRDDADHHDPRALLVRDRGGGSSGPPAPSQRSESKTTEHEIRVQ